ncbi:hypothetical protein [Fibrobacter sp.]|uniref:hypothetical protein n=1 Tax=Fibrobacter sp. TaxID=35828 RepID=UPI00388E4456
MPFSLDLAAGKNDVKFATLEGKDGPNIDQFDVTLVKAADSGSGNSTSGSGNVDSGNSDSGKASQDSAVTNSAEKDSTTRSVFLQNFALQQVYRVNFFNVKGELVGSLQNVKNDDLRNPAELSRSLPAGIYLMQVRAPGKNRQSFVVVK